MTLDTLIPPEATKEAVNFRVPRTMLQRPYRGERLLVVDDCVVVDVAPTDEVYHEWIGPELYTATVRGWHRGSDPFAGMTPAQAVRRALGLEHCPEHD